MVSPLTYPHDPSFHPPDLAKPGPTQAICDAIEVAAATATGPAAGVLGVARDSVVSTDFRGDTRSCIFDFGASIMLNPTFFKLVAWYDNEVAYSCRLVDLMVHMKSAQRGLKE